jgi:polyisoprenoid-binding protein YceI
MTATPTSPASTVTAQPLATGRWNLDPVHSVVGFRVRHFGINWLRGGFTELDVRLDVTGEGELHLAGSTPVQSISFPNEQLHGHLMSPDFFDAQLHPALSFESDDVTLAEDGTATVRGTLTMRGATHPIKLDGRWSGPVEGMAGDTRMGLELSGEVDRHAYGISWGAKLPGGQDVVAGSVRIDAELQLVLS